MHRSFLRALPVLTFAILIFGFIRPALAACTSPTGAEGVTIYNSDYHKLEFCNGANWVAVGSFSPVSSYGGSITGSFTASSANVTISTVGTTDWALWPSYIHKSTGGSQISNLATAGTTYTGDPRTFSWTGGTPTASGSKTNGVYLSTACFSFTAPATTTSHTLYLYTDIYQGHGLMIATLSDAPANSLTSYTDSSAGNGSSDYYGYYTLTYKAASTGQTLTVNLCEADSAGGNLSIAGAALQ